ncbi:hypothetical protein IVB35_22755 [Bradyrhizobium sp. 30]|nr:hypothetical protein [Bradyrhizobium sp. 30]
MFCFREHRGDLLKVIWHDGAGGACFQRSWREAVLWPSLADGVVSLSCGRYGSGQTTMMAPAAS